MVIRVMHLDENEFQLKLIYRSIFDFKPQGDADDTVCSICHCARIDEVRSCLCREQRPQLVIDVLDSILRV